MGGAVDEIVIDPLVLVNDIILSFLDKLRENMYLNLDVYVTCYLL